MLLVLYYSVFLDNYVFVLLVMQRELIIVRESILYAAFYINIIIIICHVYSFDMTPNI